MHIGVLTTLAVLTRICVALCIAFLIRGSDNNVVFLYGVALTGTRNLKIESPSHEGVLADGFLLMFVNSDPYNLA